MQSPPPLVDVLMSRRPLPTTRRSLRRDEDSTVLVRRWEPPPPARPAPRSFAPTRPSRASIAAFVAATLLLVLAATTRPIDLHARQRDERLAVSASALLQHLR